MYRKIFGLVEKMEGSTSTISTKTSEHNFELDLNTIDHEFDIRRGDRIKLYIECTGLKKVFKIEPESDFQPHIGKITGTTKKYGVIDEYIVFFFNEENQDEFHRDDKVDCLLIDGEYFGGQFQMRCVSIRKMGTMENENMFADEADNPHYEHCDSKIHEQPKDMYHKLPVGLFETIQSKNKNKIDKKLKSMIPNDLNYETYK